MSTDALNTGKLSPDEYYRFCTEQGNKCYDLGLYQEAELFLERAIRTATDMEDYDRLGYSVCSLMAVMIICKRYSEAISIGEKYEPYFSGSDWVYEIKTGLCFAYPSQGKTRIAQKLAEEVIEHKRNDSEAYHHPVTCSLYKILYNSGKCRNRVEVLSEWQKLENQVNESNSGSAMKLSTERINAMSPEETTGDHEIDGGGSNA